MNIYRIKFRTQPAITPRLVEAPSRAAARNFLAAQVFEVSIPTQRELAELISAGTPIATIPAAGDEPNDTGRGVE